MGTSLCTVHSESIGEHSFRDMDADGVVEQTREDVAYLKLMLSKYWSWQQTRDRKLTLAVNCVA